MEYVSVRAKHEPNMQQDMRLLSILIFLSFVSATVSAQSDSLYQSLLDFFISGKIMARPLSYMNRPLG
jgi:hypothetical protein